VKLLIVLFDDPKNISGEVDDVDFIDFQLHTLLSRILLHMIITFVAHDITMEQ
jgi:hypothetical protein